MIRPRAENERGTSGAEAKQAMQDRKVTETRYCQWMLWSLPARGREKRSATAAQKRAYRRVPRKDR